MQALVSVMLCCIGEEQIIPPEVEPAAIGRTLSELCSLGCELVLQLGVLLL